MSKSEFDPSVDPEQQGALTAPEPTISTDGLRTEGAVRELPVEDFDQHRSTFDIHEFIEQRRANNRDVRIIWTGRNSGVGLGKTQGALSLAKEHYPEFDANEHATLNSREAINLLRTAPVGSAVLLDEIGQIADSRRTQSTESVELTQLLQMCRYRQYLLQATLPSVRALDIRLLDMADLRVHVTKQGQAKVFRYDIRDSDPTGEMIPKILQYLEWDPIDEDPDYQILNEMKHEVYEGMGESSFIRRSEHEQIVKETEEEAEMETRNELLTNIYNRTDLTQADIGDAVGLSRRRIGEIVSDD